MGSKRKKEMSLDEIIARTGITKPHYSKKHGEHFDLLIAGEKVAHIPFNLDNLVKYASKYGFVEEHIIRMLRSKKNKY